MAAKLLFGATVLYIVSPLDVVPDWLPVLGQADDLMVLLAGFNLFLRACPRWLVSEHENAIDHPGGRRVWPAADGSAPRSADHRRPVPTDGLTRNSISLRLTKKGPPRWAALSSASSDTDAG